MSIHKTNSDNCAGLRVRYAIIDESLRIGDTVIDQAKMNEWDYMGTGGGEYPEHIDCKTISVNDTTTPDSDVQLDETSVTIHKPGSMAKYEADKLTIDGKVITAEKIQQWDDDLEKDNTAVPDDIVCKSVTCKANDTTKVIGNLTDTTIKFDDGVKNSSLDARKIVFNTPETDPVSGEVTQSGTFIDENKIIKIDKKINEWISCDPALQTVTAGLPVPLANNRTEIGFKNGTTATYIHGIYGSNHTNNHTRKVLVDSAGKLLSVEDIPDIPPGTWDGTYEDDDGNGGTGLFGTILSVAAGGVSLAAAGGATLASMGKDGFTVGTSLIDAARLAKWDAAYNRVPGTKFIDGKANQVALKNLDGTKQLTTDLSSIPEGHLFTPRPVTNATTTFTSDVVSVSTNGARTATAGSRLFSNNRVFTLGIPAGYIPLQQEPEDEDDPIPDPIPRDEYTSERILSVGAGNTLTDNAIVLGSDNIANNNSIIIGDNITDAPKDSITIGNTLMDNTRIYGINEYDITTNQSYKSVGIDSDGRLGVFNNSATNVGLFGDKDSGIYSEVTENGLTVSGVSSVSSLTPSLLTIGAESISEQHISDLHDIRRNTLFSKYMSLGTRIPDLGFSSQWLTAINSTKTISSITGSGVYMDSSYRTRTLDVKDITWVGYDIDYNRDQSNGTEYSVIYGANIVGTRYGVILGRDMTCSGTNPNYSVMVGSNNHTSNRVFCFGRDNTITGTSYGGTPSVVIGSGNNVSMPRGKGIVIGMDVQSSLDAATNPDGLSQSIVLGGGTHAIKTKTMHLGHDDITNTYVYGIDGTGSNLVIDNNEIKKTDELSATKITMGSKEITEARINSWDMTSESNGTFPLVTVESDSASDKRISINPTAMYFYGNGESSALSMAIVQKLNTMVTKYERRMYYWFGNHLDTTTDRSRKVLPRGDFAVSFENTYYIGNVYKYLYFCVPAIDFEPVKPHFVASVEHGDFTVIDRFTFPMTYEGVEENSPGAFEVKRKYHKFKCVLYHDFNNLTYDFKDVVIKFNYYEVDFNGPPIPTPENKTEFVNF